MKPMMSKKRTESICYAIFLVGLAILFYTNKWWPASMLVVGISLALKQFLSGRKREAFLSLFFFVGYYISEAFNIPWKMLIPILFIMAAIYVICREWVEGQSETEVETEQDFNKKIEEKDLN